MATRSCRTSLSALLLLTATILSFPAYGISSPTPSLHVSLEEGIEMALNNNRMRPASRYAVAMAEAQHRQVLSGYWPQISARGGYQLMDRDPNHIQPAFDVTIPAGGTIDVTVNTPFGPMIVPVNSVTVPEQDFKLMDRESWRASVEANWLLFDGGMRKGYRQQTAGQVDIMKQELRRTDLEIIDSVKRYYYGAVLAAQLHQVGRDTLARMEATLGLTESLYQGGSGSVMKTDWLNNKVMVESLRAMVAQLEKNELMAQAALANTMGLSWHDSVRPLDQTLPFTPFPGQLEEMVTTAYQFNPDWAKVEAAIGAAEGAVLTARSGYSPKLAVTGELYKWWNDYDKGMATRHNKEGWNVGVGVEIPLFSGFLTRSKVAETRARVEKIKQEQMLFKEGLGLQLRDIFLFLNAVEKSHQSTQDALAAATENRDLNTRAYQQGMVETEKVIRAQLLEALMAAQHYKARYDHIALQSQMNFVVASQWLSMLEGR